MKKGLILTLTLTISVLAGCSNNEVKNAHIENSSNVETQSETIDENHEEDKDVSKIYDMYDALDKNKLKYEYSNESTYYYERELGSSKESEMKEISDISEKKYHYILKSYSFLSELVSVSMSYNDALKYIEKVLPDDAKKEYEKYESETGIINIFYSSSKGNFVACLNKTLEYVDNGENIFNDDYICGISYMKEII